MPLQQLTPKHGSPSPREEICLFAQTAFRNQARRFGIKTDDRRRHMYVIGKTGMGKTTLMENMVLSDIYSGHGVGVVDPHGDFAEKIINFIPPHRINDVVYINPADTQFPIGFNILEVKSEEQKHLISAGLMGIFKKIWPDVWSSRMEYILNNTLLALLDYPGSTLLGINRILSDAEYRKKVIRQVKDPVIKAFWQVEFAGYSEKYRTEAVAPIQNKIGQFLSTMLIRNMVAQVKSTIDIREIMDSKKILIMNLSKGRIGEDNSRLLGGMLITKIQLAAMERVDTMEADRKDFFLYVDEFQNFASPSFANILSEARKYRLSLIMAHQYVAQLDEVVADAVFGNVGTIATFRVGGADAELLVKEFTPVFTEEDIVNLPKYGLILKLMIDGVASQPFSAVTMPPIGSPTGSADKVIRVSRERYARTRESVEDKIVRWSGTDGGDETSDDDGEEKIPSFDRQPKKEEKKPMQPMHVSVPKKKATAPTPRVEEKEGEQEERTVSLKDLLPRLDTKQPVQKEHRESDTRPHVSTDNDEKSAAPSTTIRTNDVQSEPRHEVVGSSLTIAASQSQGQQALSGEKKKRKRKRKRKNRGGGGMGQDGISPSSVQNQPLPHAPARVPQQSQTPESTENRRENASSTPQPEPPSRPQSAPLESPQTPPAQLAPDHIVKFD